MDQFCFSSSSSSQLHLFQHPRHTKEVKYRFLISSKSFYPALASHSLLPHLCLHKQPEDSSASSAKASTRDKLYSDDIVEEIKNAKKSSEVLPVVRRPVMETSLEGEDKDACDTEISDQKSDALPEEQSSSLFSIDAGLSTLAEKISIFEPDRVESAPAEKLLRVNLDLSLYKAKVLARKFQYREAEDILQKCMYYWPEDGRVYVALGKILSKQSKVSEAISVYEKGCQATQGENAYIWQCWAVLECRMGNIRRARELFDAATVADKRHTAAWHGWAILEIKQGNINKARDLLGKSLKYSGGNEYIYQTLALLEAKAKRYEQARYLFEQATKCNPKSCASWLAWAQLEAQSENTNEARKLLEKAVQASPKNRFAWHVWGAFEVNLGNIDQGRKLMQIGYILNPGDPVLLQSLALLEYKNSNTSLARVLFKRASELDPRHQPVWNAWGWMEWKEGNISTARELYQKVLSINSTNENAGRCLQAWGVLEQKVGNLSAARRLFRSSLNVNSQSFVTWKTWANLEEEQGNSVRAEEIRNLYFQQRIDVVDDESWVMGFLHIIDPAIDRLKRVLNLGENSFYKTAYASRSASGSDDISNCEESDSNGRTVGTAASGFNLDNFIRKKLSLEPSELNSQFGSYLSQDPKNIRYPRRVWRKGEHTLQMSSDQ
ncbi:unnamed protein product [Cuscuta epithymum]|uniref:Protein high chlorophyll fluorescent 107 n=1 Tax=Cuscuta epithymum TaxID=186058 RepID=A0AAV0G871_9ASTE|nr:unnamed protein product [Cuscuta epithymum]